MAEAPAPPPLPSEERQKLATQAAGKIYDCLWEIGCGKFGQFMLMGTKAEKELDVRYAFDESKIYEDLVKSPNGADLVRKFAKVMTDVARVVAKGLGDKWTQFGLHLRLKDKDLKVDLQVEPKDA